MNLGEAISLMLVTIIVITCIVYLVIKADEKRKIQQREAKAAKKAEVVANRSSWEKWRKK